MRTDADGAGTEAETREVLPQVYRAPMWALLYLHDWDPPREDRAQPVWPEIHRVYETEAEAWAARNSKISPERYFVRPAHVGRFAGDVDGFALSPTPERADARAVA